jgi:hypothetical protein
MGNGSRFRSGERVVRRDVFRGAVWSATPQRVLRDDTNGLVVAHWPGVRCLAPSPWVRAQRGRARMPRTQALEALSTGRWELSPWTWRDWAVVTSYDLAGRYFSTRRFFDARGELDRWYVNFERPSRRSGIFLDTFDLLLDLVATPDLSSWWWKDEAEYAHARRLGVVSDAEHARVDQARGEALAMMEQAAGPFSNQAEPWAPSPTWPLPVLPSAAGECLG